MRVRSVLASVALAAAMVGGAATTASADYAHDSGHDADQYVYCAGNDSLINLPLLNILDFGSGNACQFVAGNGYTN